MKPLLDIRNLHVEVKSSRPRLSVLDGISLSIYPGDVVGIVGESGCGKSALSLSVLGLLPSALKVSRGEVEYKSQLLDPSSKDELRKIRGKEIAMIFQDSMTSLNPTLPIGKQIIEMLTYHLKMSRKQAKEHAVQLLHKVGLPHPEALMKDYPHQLSGGMRQRVMIAIAISCNPGLLIADEPTTALDVTIQAQILDVLKQIRQQFGTTIMLVSHDLGVISEVCNRVAVMYAGQIVEEGTVEEIFDHPQHPYTLALLDSIPTPAKKNERLFSIAGTVPALHERGAGCRFSSRCEHAAKQCFVHSPPRIEINKMHAVSCFLAVEEGALAYAVN
ncbi:ABC transporter ATP-binding protein [Paenibacillus sp. GSMTC-2017]|uniref:ABC transporter ATP-binding protein n=1 Tax=Paenibacillus sp. GSMTC-2017 TaxID=2794350 RepID=UPI0018D9EEFF|nr:ABC transporter ATP-binding protein [Paenibacillus sp. GSMTC-2017]MBH5316974.1 ABC transporter ATP-binding protein [Paenibacillus sp. GSMTC-2017]